MNEMPQHNDGKPNDGTPNAGKHTTVDRPVSDERAEQIEQLLADVNLVAPGVQVDDRVAQALSANPYRMRFIRRAAGVAIAAAVLLTASIIALQYGGGGTVADADGAAGDSGERIVELDATLEATLATTELVDDGVVTVNDTGLPVHQLRRVTTRQFLYFNAETDETLEVTLPEEDVIHMVTEPF